MKESTSSILNNTRTLFGAQIVTWISSFVLYMFLPRYLGAESYGQLYFVISLTTLGGMVVDLGLSTFVVKEISRDRSKVHGLIANGIALRIIAWVFVVAAMFLYAIHEHYTRTILVLIAILGFGKLLEMVSDMIHRVFQSYERLGFRSIALVVQQVSMTIIAVPMLLLGFGIVEIAIAMTVSVCLNLITSLRLVPRLVTLKFTFRPGEWWTILSGGLPFLVSALFSIIYFRIDVVMLSSMTSDAVVGWYGAPYKLFDSLMFFPSILFTAIFPVFSRLWNDARPEFVRNARKAFDITVMAGLGVGAALIVLARPIIGFLFGLEQYEHSVILLQGLAFCVPLVYANFVIGSVDISSDKQKELSIVSIIAACINIGLNVWLIPLFQAQYANGAIGAMVSTIITEVVVMAMNILLLPRHCLTGRNIFTAFKSLTAACAAGTVLWYLNGWLPSWVLSGVLFAVVYIGLLAAMHCIDRQDWSIVKGLLPLGFKREKTALNM